MLSSDWLMNWKPGEGRTVTLTPRVVFVVEAKVFGGSAKGWQRLS